MTTDHWDHGALQSQSIFVGGSTAHNSDGRYQLKKMLPNGSVVITPRPAYKNFDFFF
jgi:N-dimethylarginine dimethylaminohydrolase